MSELWHINLDDFEKYPKEILTYLAQRHINGDEFVPEKDMLNNGFDKDVLESALKLGAEYGFIERFVFYDGASHITDGNKTYIPITGVSSNDYATRISREPVGNSTKRDVIFHLLGFCKK